MKTSQYFKYIRKRPDRKIIKTEWINHVVKHPIKKEVQSDGRIRKWAKIKKVDKYLRVMGILKNYLFSIIIVVFQGYMPEMGINL